MPLTAFVQLHWEIPAALLAIPTCLFALAWFHARRIPRLQASLGPAPDCMVVIPARNEEANIARAVRSFPKDTVIVVNDGSTDHTAKIAEQAGAGVIAAPPLARGAFGKPSACHAGAAVLQSKWILFADGDTWYEPAFLPSLVSAVEAAKLDFASVHLEPAGGFLDEVLGPYAAALYYCGIGPGDGFTGQCVLARREAYEFIGGYGTVARFFADGSRLASAVQRHRMRLGILRSGGLGHARFHHGEVGEGVRRSVLRLIETGAAPSVLTATLATTAVGWMPAVLWLAYGQHRMPAAAAAILPFVWAAGWYRGWRVIFAPLAIHWMLPLFWKGLLSAACGRPVTWKGRTA